MKKLKTTNIIRIEYRDLCKFVSETYNKVYNFQQQDGCKSRGTETFSVPNAYPDDFECTQIPFEVNGDEMGISFETWLNTSPDDTKKHFGSDWENEMFWERNFYPHIDMVLNDLYNKGLLDAGVYDIKIDW